MMRQAKHLYLTCKMKKRILIAPLDWGLGHAVRCIPIIKALVELNAEVVIAAQGRGEALLKKQFPELTFVNLPGFKIKYSRFFSMSLMMIWQLPKLLWGIWQEHKKLQELITKYNIDAVISDNRFGCWNKNIPSVFISHQLQIAAPPLWRKLINRINHFLINNYTQCWVPDVNKEQNLSGTLSKPNSVKIPIKHLGVLSQFNNKKTISDKPENIIMVLLSGPEPLRSVFEEIVAKQLKKTGLQSIIIRGKTEIKWEEKQDQNIHWISSLSGEKLFDVLKKVEVVISRSGYSSLMDLSSLSKKLILVPTPGQTEQEYLAKRISDFNMAVMLTQNKFDLQKALMQTQNIKPFYFENENNNLLEAAVKELLEILP
jgi:uncharacterized protein (TIGR00661 family)